MDVPLSDTTASSPPSWEEKLRIKVRPRAPSRTSGVNPTPLSRTLILTPPSAVFATCRELEPLSRQSKNTLRHALLIPDCIQIVGSERCAIDEPAGFRQFSHSPCSGLNEGWRLASLGAS